MVSALFLWQTCERMWISNYQKHVVMYGMLIFFYPTLQTLSLYFLYWLICFLCYAMCLTVFITWLRGAYYWQRASRKEQIKVKMIVGNDGTLSEIVVQGDDVQVEEMRKELKLSEKGMVYVKGIFERWQCLCLSPRAQSAAAFQHFTD